MPFPTSQGTQACIHSMLTALTEAGNETHLLTYARGEFERKVVYNVHRISDWPKDRSFCSGPSLKKLALDTRLAFALQPLLKKLQPDVIIAHHVEALLCAFTQRRVPLVYVAHTSLKSELASYFNPRLSLFYSATGNYIDNVIGKRADIVTTVSPRLRNELEMRLNRNVYYWPIPWSTSKHVISEARLQSRLLLTLKDNDLVLLYTGNLDRYQNWTLLIDVVAKLKSTGTAATLLIATASDTGHLAQCAIRSGVSDSVKIVGLATEYDRHLAHTAADLCLIPRDIPGGVPIKLLDAMARGLPVIATPVATAGLNVPDGVVIVPPNADAFTAAIRTFQNRRSQKKSDFNKLKTYISEHHSADLFVRVFQQLSDLQQNSRSTFD